MLREGAVRMDLSVLGTGRWGSFLAWYLAGLGHNVLLYGRAGGQNFEALRETRKNDFVSLPDNVELCGDLQQALARGVVLVSVPSQSLRGLMRQIGDTGVQDRTFVLCMKGLEIATGKRLSVVAAEEAGAHNRYAVWLGPGHVQEFVRGVPNCMVIDAAEAADKRQLIELFSGELIRFYYGEDLIGNELGAAAKNVVGIAAGMLDGYGLSSLKGALMSRGCREIARLIRAMGGNELSAYGLCHLGDYEATVFSQHSHNRRYGEWFVQGKSFDKLAEGCHTAKALRALGARHGVELPITEAVYNTLYEGVEPRQALDGLFSRSLKQEFL